MALVVSIALGLAGAIVTRALAARLPPAGDPHGPWSLGLAAMVPAWLVAFLSLLGSQPGMKPEGVALVSWVLSAGAALGGAIATEALLRGAIGRSGRRSVDDWRLGALSLVPAWAVAAAGLLLRG